MLTLFSIPKAFKGHTAVIQFNAIRSWLELKPSCQIILLGDDEGTAEMAAELGVLHLPDVQRSEAGTPLISSIFALAQANAKYPLLCYVNADIILLSDFLKAANRIPVRPLLMVGRRWDLDVTEPLDFTDKEWESKLRMRLEQSGRLHGISGMDYFLYSSGLFDTIPPFAVGRTTWDTWLIYSARQQKTSIVDASNVVSIVHQNHDYGHVAGATDKVIKGPESIKNWELGGNGRYVMTLEHATHRLTQQTLKRNYRPRDLYFRLDAMSRLHPALGFLRWPIRLVAKLKGAFRS